MLKKIAKIIKFQYIFKIRLEYTIILWIITLNILPVFVKPILASDVEPPIFQNTDSSKKVGQNESNEKMLVEVSNARVEDDIASGIFGTSKWRVDSEGILHIGEGEFSTSTGESPWRDYRDDIEYIVFEGPVMANANSSSLFNALNKVQTFENLSLLNTANVTNMSNMFSDMSSLTSIDLSNFATSKVTTLQNLFARSTALVNVDLSNFDTSNVTGMNGMFNGASSLKVLNLSSFDTSKVTNTTSMFYKTFNLSQITLGRNFKFGSGLPGVPVSDMYTGKWINVGSGSVGNPLGENIWTSEEPV
ncbi:BspA family leucine-rich repeat surface protein [Lactococcus garvieae]|uniref:BspA family leucine-rich repeat surface protein n=1 Tax=Lactococcus garvieae TaxID=1363 RepID=A0AA46YT53_9LACT|nr:BspA family leucine-rich repeat surface protein [Lactococcus garvieae]UYT10304.1 BspA family leucine-rich repeat surface protein [Lactococcus garvieae]